MEEQKDIYSASAHMDAQGYVVNHRNLFNHIFDFTDVNIKSLPGLAGKIQKLYSDENPSRLPMLDLAYTMQTLALATVGVETVTHCKPWKLNIITMVGAKSSSGKNDVQELLEKFANRVGLACFNDLRSDKDLILGVMENGGKVVYVLDECKAFFDKGESKGSNVFVANLRETLMALATKKGTYSMSRSMQDAVDEDMERRIAREEKKMNSKTATEKTIAECSARIEVYKKHQLSARRGINCPHMNVALATTEFGMESAFTESNMRSGLIPRSSLNVYYSVAECDGARKRDEEVRGANMQDFNDLALTISNLHKKYSDPEQKFVITMTDEAKSYFADVQDVLLSGDVDSHPIFNALYGRWKEHIIKLASLLSIETGIIDTTALTYAVAISCQSMDNTVRMDRARRIGDKSANPEMRLAEEAARLFGLIEKYGTDKYAAESTLRQKFYGKNPEAKDQKFRVTIEDAKVKDLFELCARYLQNDATYSQDLEISAALRGDSLRFRCLKNAPK